MPAIKSDSKLKPLYLADVFRECTDELHRLTVPQLAEHLIERGVDAERKGVYRDIEALREYGLDIIKTSTGYYLGRRDFSPAEIKLLVSAVQAAQFITERRSAAIIDKLALQLSSYQAEGLMMYSNIGGVKCTGDDVLLSIETVNTAVAENRQITFTYIKQDVNKRNVVQRSGKRYRVNPYAMVWVQDKLYLVCNMEGRDNLTHFRLDRMCSVRTDVQMRRHFSEVCEYTDEFLAGDYARKCLNMFGGEPECITLRCANSLIGDVLDRFGPDVPVRRDGEEGFFTVTVDAVPSEGFLGYVSMFGELMEIVTPEHLRYDMERRLTAALSKYKSK